MHALRTVVCEWACCAFCIKVAIANSEDPDQMPHFVASELDLHYLHIPPITGSCLKRVNTKQFENGRTYLCGCSFKLHTIFIRV